MPAAVPMRRPQWLPSPAKRVASWRDPTANVASTEMAIAVPSDMTRVPRIPAHNKALALQKASRISAPVHGRMPTEAAMPNARLHDQAPCS